MQEPDWMFPARPYRRENGLSHIYLYGEPTPLDVVASTGLGARPDGLNTGPPICGRCPTGQPYTLPMQRRNFLSTLAAVPALAFGRPRRTEAAILEPRLPAPPPLPRGKVTRVRIFAPPNPNPLFNQSDLVCTVETDFGITGIGEGGSKDTLEQCAGTLIGKDPFKIEAIWQEVFIAWFYPPGREKTHALGA